MNQRKARELNRIATQLNPWKDGTGRLHHPKKRVFRIYNNTPKNKRHMFLEIFYNTYAKKGE